YTILHGLRLIIQRVTTCGPKMVLPLIQLRSVKSSAPSTRPISGQRRPAFFSPDLKTLDNAVWGTLKKETNTTSHLNGD
ncbi:Uncharacterized protein FKW44_021527, partial [Caligus rogercresseyi]